MNRTAPTDRWAAPTHVSDLDMVFPANVGHLMPAYDDELCAWTRTDEGRRWVKFQQDWFFKGLSGAVFTSKEGVDQRAALRHLKTVQGSFEPKHEHKEAAVAYLASRWFDDVTYEGAR